MKSSIAALASYIFLCTSFEVNLYAQSRPIREGETYKRLQINDVAPPLSVTSWLSDRKIEKFEGNKVYVVEFWAPWCAPCRAEMEALTRGSRKVIAADVSMVFFTTTAFGIATNSNEKSAVTEFVNRHGSSSDVAFAFEEGTETRHNWFGSDTVALPIAFVVNRSGRIAFIGHPVYLDFVVPMVTEGRKSLKEIEAIVVAMRAEETESLSTFQSNPKKCLERIANFEQKYPLLRRRFMHIKFRLLPLSGDNEAAILYYREMFDELLEEKQFADVKQAFYTILESDGGSIARNSPIVCHTVSEFAAKLWRLTEMTDPDAALFAAKALLIAGNQQESRSLADNAIDAAQTRSPEYASSTSKRAYSISKDCRLFWSNRNGKSIRAAFVRSDDVTLVVRMNEKEHSIPLNSLSEESQKLVGHLNRH